MHIHTGIKNNVRVCLFKTVKEPAGVKLSNLVRVMLTYKFETTWFSYLVRCT